MKVIENIRYFTFKLHQRLLRLFVQFHFVGTHPSELGVQTDKPIVFALQDASYAAQLLIEETMQTVHWPSTQNNNTSSFLGDRSRFFSTYRRIGPLFRRRRQAVMSSYLQTLVERCATEKKSVQIIPVSIFWGRSPDRENSFIRIWLQNNSRIGGKMATLLAILLNGRNTVVCFSQPLQMQTIIEGNTDISNKTRKLHRILQVHFKQTNATVLGPDLSHRKTLVHKLLSKPKVLSAISQEVKTKNISRAKVKKIALGYADEIAANMSHSTVRFMYLFLTWLWNKLYKGIQIHNLKGLQQVHQDNEIIYVPCHRSHIDYLLLSYVLYVNGFQLPHIAAGINLNIPIIGPILRRGGAFFMRRTFRGNALYSAVFDEYLHSVFTQGYATEYFIEGGRSRSGYMLPPKTGMLAMTVRSYLLNSNKPIIFMPVYIGYEKIFESASYQAEQSGQRKKKESFFGALSTLRQIKGSFGRVNVTFGEPIHLSAFLDNHQSQWRNTEELIPDTINLLALNVVTAINQATSLNPINMVASVLLSYPNQTADKASLISQLDDYSELLKQVPYHRLQILPEGDAACWVDYALSMNSIQEKQHPLGNLITVTPRQKLSLYYYRNNCLHLFSLPSLLACLLVPNDALTLNELTEQASRLYSYLKAELFLPWSYDELNKVIQQWLEVLVELGYINKTSSHYRCPNSTCHAFVKLSTLARPVTQILERYYATLKLLIKSGSNQYSMQKFIAQSTLLTERVSLLTGINSLEFSNKRMSRTLINTLITQQVLQINEQKRIIFDESLSLMLAELERLLSPAFCNTAQQITLSVSTS